VIEEPIQQSEPVEVVGRRYAPAEPQRTYAVNPQVMQPSAGVVIVAPGAQYGEDGIAIVNGRQDSSWQLCQVDRPGAGHNRCISTTISRTAPRAIGRSAAIARTARRRATSMSRTPR
jgi:hypothetical protein